MRSQRVGLTERLNSSHVLMGTCWGCRDRFPSLAVPWWPQLCLGRVDNRQKHALWDLRRRPGRMGNVAG